MKRIITLFLSLFLMTGFIFAQDSEEGDDYDDGYVYERNGAGDQFVKADFYAHFPIGFNNKLYVGGGFSIGYYRFFTNWLALGGEVSPTYNVSIGNKSLITVPVTVGAIVQPTLGNFEFPVGITAGIASSTWANNVTYFPSFAAKAYAGVYYRINDSWSVGVDGSFFWIPQWLPDPTLNYHGLFASAGLALRYHF